MKILAIDTLTDFCSVGLCDSDVITSREEYLPRGHTRILFQLLNDLLQERKIEICDLDGLAFSNGPGSFTGIRLTMGVINGFCLVKPMLIWAKSYLWIMALEAYLKTGICNILVIQDAKMKEWYVGHYELLGGVWRGQDELLSTSQVEEKLNKFSSDGIITGDGASKFVPSNAIFIQDHVCINTMLDLAKQEFLVNKNCYEIPNPSYMRRENAWNKCV